MALDLKWSAIASIIYFSLYTFLLLILAYHVHRTGDYKNKKSFLTALWKKRGIYAAILVHLYDTATDIGVIIEWWALMQHEKKGIHDYATIDMTVFVWCAISFLILYRVVTVIISINANGNDGTHWSIWIFDIFLSIIDMYIIRTVYKSIKGDIEEPSPKQKMIQLAESVFESLPQVVLQSVFIIRSNNDIELAKNSSIYLVGLSLIASLFSVTNKYIWLDKEAVVVYAREAHVKAPKCGSYEMINELPVCPKHKLELIPRGETFAFTCEYCDLDTISYKCPQSNDCDVGRFCETCYVRNTYKHNKNAFIRIWYLVRALWRFSFVGTRFTALALVWAVLGGAFIGIFVSFSFLFWTGMYFTMLTISYNHLWSRSDGCGGKFMITLLASALFAMASLISNIPSSKYTIAIAHTIEIGITMIVVTIFAFNESIDCSICADSITRQAHKNVYIKSFIIAGWIWLVIDVVLYIVLLHKQIIYKAADITALGAFMDGLFADDEN